jgi:signal peptide peptidase SppA
MLVLSLLNYGTNEATPIWEAAQPYTKGNGATKIAFVPVQGVLSKDGPAWLGSSYDNISRAVEDAASNPEVKRIVLAVDSPGGEVRGCPETAAIIQAAAKVKALSAIVDGQAASAAYWLTSQARDITVTPSGEVGSVGIKMVHADISKKLEDAGIHITEMTSGNLKAEWSPYKPLSEEAQANMQTRMDAVHGDFLNAVASSRGERASQDIRASRFGEGRMFSAKDAMGHGLVDAVMSTRDFFRTLLPAVEQESSAPAFPLRAALSAHLEHVKRRDQV